MDINEVKQELDALAKGITHDAAEFLKMTSTAAALLPIDGTDRYVAIGTLAMISKVTPIAAPTVHSTTAAEWISVDERLPMKYCLAVYVTPRGQQRIIRAMHVKQFEIEANGDECDSETNDADELEYIKAGWYECIDNWGEYSSVAVCEGVVTHWMPLPPALGQQIAHVPTAAEIRAQALEEAAAVCDEENEDCPHPAPRRCADMIRALVGQQVAQGEKGGDDHE